MGNLRPLIIVASCCIVSTLVFIVAFGGSEAANHVTRSGIMTTAYVKINADLFPLKHGNGDDEFKYRPLPLVFPSSSSALNNRMKHMSKSRNRNWNECAQFQCKFQFMNKSTSLNTHKLPSGKLKRVPPVDEVTPCSTIIHEMLVDTVKVLEMYKGDYYLAFGSLLGSHHIQSVFGWTKDADIAVDSLTFRTLAAEKAIGDDLYGEHGLILFRNGQRLFRVCPSRQWFRNRALDKLVIADMPTRSLQQYLRDNVYVDIYEEYAVVDEDNNMTATGKVVINPSEVELNHDDIYPLVNCLVNGRSFKCPARTELILSSHYGAEDWNKTKEIFY